jgi:hypothetical protein
MKIGDKMVDLPPCPFCKEISRLKRIRKTPFKWIKYVQCNTNDCARHVMTISEWVNKCKFYENKQQKVTKMNIERKNEKRVGFGEGNHYTANYFGVRRGLLDSFDKNEREKKAADAT